MFFHTEPKSLDKPCIKRGGDEYLYVTTAYHNLHKCFVILQRCPLLHQGMAHLSRGRQKRGEGSKTRCHGYIRIYLHPPLKKDATSEYRTYPFCRTEEVHANLMTVNKPFSVRCGSQFQSSSTARLFFSFLTFHLLLLEPKQNAVIGQYHGWYFLLC